MKIFLSPCWVLAGKEFRDRVRNRWVLAVTFVFMLLSLLISYFGAAAQGQIGMTSLELTIASLVSLSLYLIPLIALILGFDAVVGERERGSLALLMSLPLTASEFLLGKFLGLAAALSLATCVGLSLVAGIIAQRFGWPGVFHYLGFMLSSVLLGLAFLSLAIWLSVLASERSKASGMAIAVWFALVLVFDLLLLGLLVLSGGAYLGDLLGWCLLLNPTDVFRLLNMFSSADISSLYGMGSLLPQLVSRTEFLVLVMLGWIAFPLALARWRFKV